VSLLADGYAGEGVRNADPCSDEGQTHHRIRDAQGEACGNEGELSCSNNILKSKFWTYFDIYVNKAELVDFVGFAH
jgi:hypothetical protein